MKNIPYLQCELFRTRCVIDIKMDYYFFQKEHNVIMSTECHVWQLELEEKTIRSLLVQAVWVRLIAESNSFHHFGFDLRH